MAESLVQKIRGSRYFQAGMLLLVCVLLLLVYLQRSAGVNHRAAWDSLRKLHRASNAGERAVITQQEAIDILDSDRVIGPRQGKQLHIWRGPFVNYYIRLHLDPSNGVFMYDDDSNMSASPAAPVADRSHSPEVQREIRLTEKLDQVRKVADNAVRMKPAPLNEAGLARVKELMAKESDTHLPPKSETLLQVDYVQRRQQWYQTQWVDSFRKYASPEPEWADLAEEFLTETAKKAGRYGIQNVSGSHYELAEQLMEMNCSDPLVKAIAMGGRMNSFRIDGRELGREFMESDYPADVAYFAAYPFVSPSELLQMQVLRAPQDEEPRHDLFNIEDPLLMRVVLDHITHHYNHGLPEYTRLIRPELVLATQESTPWLRHMLLAKYSSNSEQEATSLFNAWSELPTNPEAPQLLLLSAWRMSFDTGYARSFVGEDKTFWFKQSIAGQFDYLPAYQTYMRFSPKFPEFINECVATERFDTDVPMLYPSVLRDRVIRGYNGWNVAKHVIMRDLLGDVRVHQGLVKLARGYANHPSYSAKIRNFLTCSAFYNGRYDVARNRYKLLKDTVDHEVFDFCGVTAGQLLADAPSHDSERFSLGRPGSISRLAFSQAGDAIICMDDTSQTKRFELSSGKLDTNHQSASGDVPVFVPITPDAPMAVVNQTSGFLTMRSSDGVDLVRELGVVQPAQTSTFVAGPHPYWATIAAATDKKGLAINLHRSVDGEIVDTLPTPYERFGPITTSENGKFLVATGIHFLNSAGLRPLDISVYDIEGKRWILSFRTFNGYYDQFQMSPNGKTVAIAGGDQTDRPNEIGKRIVAHSAKVVPINDVEAFVVLPHPAPVTCVQYMGNSLLATGCVDGVVRIWNLPTGKLAAKLIGHNHQIDSLAFLPTQELLASGGRDGRICIWDVTHLEDQIRLPYLQAALPFGGLVNMYVDPKTQDVVTLSESEGSRRWHADKAYGSSSKETTDRIMWDADLNAYSIRRKQDPENPDLVTFQIRHEETGRNFPEITEVAGEGFASALITPDAKSVVTNGDIASVRDITTGKPWPWGVFRGHRGIVTDITAVGRRVATLSTSPDMQVRIWELPKNPSDASAQMRLITELSTELSGSRQSITLSPDGQLLLIADGDSYTHFWDIKHEKLRGTLKGQDAVLSPDGNTFAINDNNFHILICDAETMQEVKRIPTVGGGPRFLQWGKHGKTLYFSVGNCVSAVEVASGKRLLPQAASADSL